MPNFKSQGPPYMLYDTFNAKYVQKLKTTKVEIFFYSFFDHSLAQQQFHISTAQAFSVNSVNRTEANGNKIPKNEKTKMKCEMNSVLMDNVF